MKNILIVEDEEDHLDIVKIILEQHSYNVLTSANGREGVEATKKELPSLVILDIMLPEMNGYEACRAIKSDPRTKSIPVILLSVKSGQEDIETGYKAGANDYMVKPFSLEELINKVKKHLGEE